MDDVEIRRGNEEDFKACHHMCKGNDIFLILNRGTDEEVVKYFTDYKTKGWFLVAETKKGVVGFVTAEITVGNIFYIDVIMVTNTHHRKGIGRALMKKMRDEALRSKSWGMVLFALKDDEKALGFYTSLGMSKEKLYYEFLEKF